MAYYRWQVIKKTKKTHYCYGCEKVIPVRSTCNYGFTTDKDVNMNGVSYGYFCTECKEVNK